ncbi:MAG: AAA family ATPase [Spirochaetaceae bacterium]
MIHDRVGRLLEAMEHGVYEREDAVRLAFLATAAGESVFFLGPPGVAKSLIARRLKFAFRDATSFEYLMGRFSTPDEIFGPISIQRLKQEDRYERITDRYLPDADIVFLDEIWKAGPPIQNALLTALNEKRFRNGTREIRIPMKGLISASNHIPETDESRHAFWDRFLIRLPLRAIEEDEHFYRLLTDAMDEYEDTVPAELKVTEEEYAQWQRIRPTVELPRPVLRLLSRLRRRLAEAPANEAPGEEDSGGGGPVYVSDRRWKKIARLLRTSALLNDRGEVNCMDLGLLRHCLWNRPEEIPRVRTLLAGELAAFDFGEDVHPRSIARELGELKRRLREATVETAEERIAEPVVYRGEYLRVEDFDDADLALIWRGDYESLPWDTAERGDGRPPGGSCELFLVREEDGRTESRTYENVTRCAEPGIRIAGTRYAIEHRTAFSTTARSRVLRPEERSRYRAEARTLAERAAGAAADAAARYEAAAGEPHLFVEQSFAESAYAGLGTAAWELEQLRLTAARLADDLEGED